MAVLLYAENSGGIIKKAVLEAASYGKNLADTLGVGLHAVVIGTISDGELNKLSGYGVSRVFAVRTDSLNTFNEKAYSRAVSAVAKAHNARAVILSQSYDGKALAPRISVQLGASLVSGATTPASVSGDGLKLLRTTNSGKGIETIQTLRSISVITLKVNSFGLKENATGLTVEPFDFQPAPADFGAITKEFIKTASKISITEADTVVSGGRGLKGPENWGILEQLAEALKAGTACSKPVSDMDWRPHHEHVGQTGIQIGPNLYIAIGISGAIQHLAGVNSSKNIVVINKDPEAPFFKIADYGIVGDLFQVVPQLTEAVIKIKAHS